MRLFHTHFGRDGGAERFFVSLVNALAEAGVDQTLLIRPGRAWRDQLPASADVEVRPSAPRAAARRHPRLDAARGRLHA